MRVLPFVAGFSLAGLAATVIAGECPNNHGYDVDCLATTVVQDAKTVNPGITGCRSLTGGGIMCDHVVTHAPQADIDSIKQRLSCIEMAVNALAHISTPGVNVTCGAMPVVPLREDSSK